jgi:hypothetical protein
MTKSIGFKGLPFHLTVLFFTYLIVPFWSLSILPTPWAAVREGAMFHGIAIFVGYWALPLLISFTIYYRSYLFIPLFLADCFVLMIVSLTAPDVSPVPLLVLKAIVVGFVAVTAIFFHKDTLYVVLSNKARFWRKFPRYTTNVAMQLRHPEAQRTIRGHIADYSYTGLGAYVHPGDLEEFQRCRTESTAFQLVVETPRGECAVPVSATLQTPTILSNTRVGFEALDDEAMRSMLNALSNASRQNVVERWVGLQLMNNSLRRGALAVWCGAIMAAFGLESCGRGMMAKSTELIEESTPGVEDQGAVPGPDQAMSPESAANAPSDGAANDAP